MLAGAAAVYAGGLAWLALFAGTHTLALRLIPFDAGGALKLLSR